MDGDLVTSKKNCVRNPDVGPVCSRRRPAAGGPAGPDALLLRACACILRASAGLPALGLAGRSRRASRRAETLANAPKF